MPINNLTGTYKPHDPSDTASAYIEADEKEQIRMYGKVISPFKPINCAKVLPDGTVIRWVQGVEEGK